MPTELASADIGVFAGQVELSGLQVRNPTGFRDPHFLTLADTQVDVSLGSLSSDVVEAPLVVLDGIELRLERTLDGSNYGVILENLKRFEKGEKKEPKPDGKKFVIRTVQLRNITVHVDAVPVGGALGDLTSARISVPELTLHDIGSAGQPMSVAELTAVVLKAILASAIDVGGGVLPEDVIGELGDRLAEMLDLKAMGVGDIEGLSAAAADLLGLPAEALADEVQGAVEGAVQDATEDARRAVEDATDAVRKETDRARERIGDLLPGRKKEDPDKKPKEEPKDDPKDDPKDPG